MSTNSVNKTVTAILSVAALGTAISFAGTALAQEKDKNVTEDQIVRALAPE